MRQFQTHREILEKRDQALEIIDRCLFECSEASDSHAIRGIVDQAIRAAIRLQGEPDERTHLAKTLCHIAHRLRKLGWNQLARHTLDQALGANAIDEYVYAELAECWLAVGDYARAELSVEQAINAGVKTSAIYASLIRFCGRTKDVRRAQVLFERAARAGANDRFTYASLIFIHARMHDLRAAREVFKTASDTGNISPAAYAGLALAMTNVGELARAADVLQEAGREGLGSSVLTQVILRAYIKQHRLRDARATFEGQKPLGHIDAICYVALIKAYHESGRHRDAFRLTKVAMNDVAISAEVWRICAISDRYRRKAGSHPHSRVATVSAQDATRPHHR